MIRVILTDIEGTTSSISFVHDVLFPYAKSRLPRFIEAEAPKNPRVQAQLDVVSGLTGLASDDLAGLSSVLLQWVREDRKETALKALQGMIWEKGYRAGDFQGHVYADAAEKIRQWHDRGLRQYVYSSGSEQAQRLLFEFSTGGDLTPYFSGYFDTRVGVKRDPNAYQVILNELGVEPETVLFLSDIEQELEAAEAVGLKTIWLVRDGVHPDTDRRQARDFDEVDQILTELSETKFNE
jgi:enolase-phosphatase E1